jgi:hypothetical protein
MTIERIQKRFKTGNYRMTTHCFERCIERNISPQEIKEAVIAGEIIEEYPVDKYGPSCLICGNTEQDRILHVQVSVDPVWVITAYDPTLRPEKWDSSFKRRQRIV